MAVNDASQASSAGAGLLLASAKGVKTVCGIGTRHHEFLVHWGGNQRGRKNGRESDDHKRLSGADL